MCFWSSYCLIGAKAASYSRLTVEYSERECNRMNDLQFLTRILKFQRILLTKKRDENGVQKVWIRYFGVLQHQQGRYEEKLSLAHYTSFSSWCVRGYISLWCECWLYLRWLGTVLGGTECANFFVKTYCLWHKHLENEIILGGHRARFFRKWVQTLRYFDLVKYVVNAKTVTCLPLGSNFNNF